LSVLDAAWACAERPFIIDIDTPYALSQRERDEALSFIEAHYRPAQMSAEMTALSRLRGPEADRRAHIDSPLLRRREIDRSWRIR
jgi:hypothetical protein